MTLITDGFQRRAKLTIPAAQVGSGGVSNYSIVITEAVIGASHSFWTEAQANGGDLRASTDSGGNTRLALDIISLDTSAKTCEINIGQISLSSSIDNEFYLWWKHASAQSQPAAGDSFGQYAAYEAANVARWDMGLTSGAVNDRTSNVNHGTRYGTGGANNLPQETTGKIRKAISFDGVDDYVELGTPASLDYSGTVSISLWHKTNGDYTSSQGLVVNGSAGTGRGGITFGVTDNKYDWLQSGGTLDLTSTTSFSTDEWRHIVVVRTGSTGNWTISLYINGVLDKQNTTTNNPRGNSNTTIGKFGSYNGYYPKGLIDDVRIYNRALTAAGITTNYNNTNSPSTFASLAAADSLGSLIARQGIYSGGRMGSRGIYTGGRL